MKTPLLIAPFLCTLAYGQSGNPAMSSQPNAQFQYAPNRTYHLIRASAKYDIDEVRQHVKGSITNTFSMIESGARKVHFDTAVEKVTDVMLDGKPAKSTFTGGSLDVEVPNGAVGATHVMSVRIEGSIFHWFTPTKADPHKAGLWAEGLTALPVAWAAPNDFTSTDIEATVPNAWTVVSNGILASDKPAGPGRHTMSWRMDQPHANYLTSIIAGPYDVFRDTWKGKPLIMTCPKGYGDRLEYTFANTKDILSYFSDVLGVTYAWPKYGQTVIYDHPYGEEDVNATIYPMYWGSVKPFLSLANAREGQHPFEWVIAHETAHQWFGDLVTCKDWGHTWLNEGMTTFMEMMYTRHSRGELESLRQVEAYSQRYFGESRKYRRPIATNYFSNQGDYHTYYKGGTVLMSLRKMLGDAAFFRGLNRYLTRHYLGNVETNDLVEDMTDASGVNLHPWFDQWIFKPGHPVISWSWSFDPIKREVNVLVKQTQDTSDGTPIFDVPTHVGIVTASGLRREAIHLNAKEQTFTFAAGAPDAVLFDPDHEFVREIPTMPWASSEYSAVFRFAPNPIDRAFALDKLLDGTPTAETLQMIAQELRKDTAPFPGLPDTSKLASIHRKELRSFWLAEITHPNYARRANAATGLAGVADPADKATLHRLMGNDQPYVVVAAALRGLAVSDFESVRAFALEQGRTSPSSDLREAALDVLADAKANGWIEAILTSASDANITLIRCPGVEALKRIPSDDPRLPGALRSALESSEPPVVSCALRAAAALRVKAILPDLERMKAKGNTGAEIDAAIKACSG
jgi:aminopeptidase N